MSRCSSLYQALANASANSSGFSRKRREIFSYAGSKRSARSVVSIVGGAARDAVVRRPGTVSAPAPSLATPLVGAGRGSRSAPTRSRTGSRRSSLPHCVGVLGPGDLEAAGDRVARPCRCRRCSSSRGPAPRAGSPRARGRRRSAVAGAVGLAEGVAAGDQRDGLLVVHRHPARRSRGCRGPRPAGRGCRSGPRG